MRYVLLILTGLICLPAGCGDPDADRSSDDRAASMKDPAPSPTSHDRDDQNNRDDQADDDTPPPGDGGAADRGQASDDGATQADADNAAAGGPGQGDAPQPALSFEEQFNRVGQLERQARFADALQLARQLQARHPTGPNARRLAEAIGRLARYRSQAVDLRYALDRLGGDAPWEARAVARRKLLNAGELGQVFLEKLVRTGADGERPDAALGLLREMRAWTALPTLLDRAANQPDAASTRKVLATVRALLEEVPADRRGQFSEGFAAIFARLQEDADFGRRQMAELLVQLITDWLGRDYTKFNAYVDATEAAAWLEAYLRVAGDSDDQTLRSWGLTHLLALSGSASGLVGWWPFDAVGPDRAPDRSGRGHDAVVDGPTVVDGRYAKALRFDGEDDFVRIADAAVFSGGFGAARTVSVVFKTDRPDGFQTLVEKQWDGGAGDWGLSVSGGQLEYYSEARVSDYRTAGGRIEADRWHHAVLSFSQTREKFEIALYLDGRQVAAETESDHISADTAGDVFIGARRYNNSNNQGQARAVIDDVRIYDRRFSADQVAGLDPGAYRRRTYAKAGHTAAGELLAHLQAAAEPTRRRIALTAIRQIFDTAGADDRAAYRPVVAALVARAGPHRTDEDQLPPPWRRAIDAAADTWFAGDAQALQAWLQTRPAPDHPGG